MTAALTPVQAFEGWHAKREDLAGYTDEASPSGAKVRQYRAMIEAAPDNAVLGVGCSADSAMQIYVAHSAHVYGRRAYVVVPGRNDRTAATRYAAAMGAEIIEVSPGYPSVYRARLRALAGDLGVPMVRWDLGHAARDTAAQVVNLPADARRVIVPTGSGLTAAGIIGGLAAIERPDVEVVAVCVSGLASEAKVRGSAEKFFGADAAAGARLHVIPPASAYGRPTAATLPDGTALDPFYAAKARDHVRPGDVFWVSGRRPAAAAK